MPRKVYSDQFKRDAVAMYENDPHLSLKAAAEDLGIYRTTLRTWVDTYGTGAKTQSPPVAHADRAKQLTDAEKIRQLQQENARLKEERDILRKAAKYFMEETNW